MPACCDPGFMSPIMLHIEDKMGSNFLETFGCRAFTYVLAGTTVALWVYVQLKNLHPFSITMFLVNR